MNLLDWININRPGQLTELDDRFEIDHLTGERSTLFKNLSGGNVNPILGRLGDIYSRFDGIDLFSSTFKIASVSKSKYRGEVSLVENLAEFAVRENWSKALLGEKVTPFMYQAGIGSYAVGNESGKIFEWDDEQQLVSDEFLTVVEVLTEWLDAVT